MKVAVGICAYNEEKNIGRLLEELATTPMLNEIIVVSSGSTDRTNRIVNERSSMDSRVRLIVEPARAGKAKAVNVIIHACRSDVIVFISADTLPERGSIARLVRWFEDPRIGAASARPVPVNCKRGFGHAAHIMWSAHWLYLWNLMLHGNLAHVSGEMCALSAKLLNPLPTEIINEDAYIATIMKRTARRGVILDPSARVFIKAPTNVVDLIDQRHRVLAGHKQIRKTTGYFPTVLTASWWMYPLASIHTATAVFREFGLKVWAWGVVLLFCEVLANAFASGIFGHSTQLLWKPIRSTKRVEDRETQGTRDESSATRRTA